MLKESNKDSLNLKYDKSSQKIIKYLTTLKISRVINRKKFWKFKINAFKFLIKKKAFISTRWQEYVNKMSDKLRRKLKWNITITSRWEWAQR